MRDYINIGCTPSAEKCAQVGDPDYTNKAKEECKRFIKQLVKEFGEPPSSASLKIKSFHHEFGIYHEVVCYFNEGDEEAENYCYTIEADMPEYWEDDI